MNSGLTPSIIRNEAALLIAIIHEPYGDAVEISKSVCCTLADDIANDLRRLRIDWNDAGENRTATKMDLDRADLAVSLDEFSKRILRPLIISMKPGIDPR